MASSNFILKAFNPASALAEGSYVTVNSDGKVALPSLTAKVIGSVEYAITDDDVTANRAVTVRLFGPTRVVPVTGVPITAGDTVYLASGGVGTSVSITGSQVLGIAVETASENGALIEIASIN